MAIPGSGNIATRLLLGLIDDKQSRSVLGVNLHVLHAKNMVEIRAARMLLKGSPCFFADAVVKLSLSEVHGLALDNTVLVVVIIKAPCPGQRLLLLTMAEQSSK